MPLPRPFSAPRWAFALLDTAAGVPVVWLMRYLLFEKGPGVEGVISGILIGLLFQVSTPLLLPFMALWKRRQRGL